MQRITQQQSRRIRTKAEDLNFVRCRICGKPLRVIGGRHLSTHGTDRETYMQQYRLSPDQLCSKTFRVNHSSRNDYCAHNKREWVIAIKKVHKQHGQIFAGYLQDNLPHLYNQGVWLFGSWDNALCAAGFTPEKMRLWAFWDQAKLIRQIQTLRKRRLPLYAKYVLDNHKKLFSAALRQFGSWEKALIAAGIEIPKYAYGSRLGILRALDALHGQSTATDIAAPLKSLAFITAEVCKKPSLQQKKTGLRHPRVELQQHFLGCTGGSKAWHTPRYVVTICRWSVPLRSSSGVGVKRCMLPASILTSTMFIAGGSERYPKVRKRPSSLIPGALTGRVGVRYQLAKSRAS
jgi:hypothetical protein